MGDLVKVAVDIPTRSNGVVQVTAWARSKDAELVVLDAKQIGDIFWNVTHRATGMRVPGAFACETRQEALEYLDELATVKGWERIRWPTSERGPDVQPNGLSKRLARDSWDAVERVNRRRRDREASQKRAAAIAKAEGRS